MSTRLKTTSADAAVLASLKILLNGGNAHVSVEKAFENVEPQYRGVVPEGLPYSLWQLAEHIRIAQWDILEFCRNPGHQSPQWPDEYWPEKPEPENNREWDKTLQAINADRKSFIELLEAPDADFYTPFAHADNNQNLIREAMLITDHTAYHTGEAIIIRRLLGIWN